jgi:hypothetical protein
MKFICTTLALVAAAFAVLFSTSALAQFVWLDASGRKVFSDQPPPASISAKRILQQPGKTPATMPITAAEDATDGAGKPKETSEAANKTVPTPKIASKDKDLEVAKKKVEDEAAAKKKTEEDARNVAKADNCVRAKQAKATFDSGVLLGHTNSKGERGIMDETTRMVETKRVEGIIASDCK